MTVSPMSTGAGSVEVPAKARSGNPASTPDISIATIIWRDGHYLPSFIDSLAIAQRVADIDVELVIVVNGPDGQPALEELQAREPAPVRFRVIELPTNLGFTGGANAGCAAVTGQVIVMDNLDLEFDPNFLVELRNIVWDLEAPTFLAPAVLTPGDASPLPGGRVEDGLVARDTMHRLKQFRGERRFLTPVPAANGSCFIFNRALLDKRVSAIGALFDPEYHSYYEDVDLFWWAEHESVPTLYAPTIRVVHHHGGSCDGKIRFAQRPPGLRASLMANYRMTVWKHARGWTALPGWAAGELGYVVLCLRSAGPNGLVIYGRSWRVAIDRVRRIRERRGTLRTRG